MKLQILWFKRIFAGLLALTIIGCVTAISPAPSPKILTDSQSTMTEGLILLQKMSGGAESGTYDQRKDDYSKLLANLQSIAVLIEARPPGGDLDSDALQKFLDYAKLKGVIIPVESLGHPNLKAAQNAVVQMTFLRDIDQNKDCGQSAKCPTDSNVKLAMKGYITSMGAVIYYEQLLADLKGGG
ncbi:hypothetical protein RJ45_12855 [Photobacterium gaetbulicola]|uniref:Lipoprotein n=1 Tax=Photobacterium gaetbulicola TaxID=1295392 RepID=A0A0B9GX38_9GAMM|nr:hypothetical protein [Photobacterium gaetbulicola]KHT63286.1 hypothetical protein RJ45_12855 [Photobacterium gaetbulicola]